MCANVVSGRSREREFTSPAASLLSSHDHPAGRIGRFWMRWLIGGAALKRTHSPASQGAGAMPGTHRQQRCFFSKVLCFVGGSGHREDRTILDARLVGGAALKRTHSSWRYAGNPSPTALFFQQGALFCCRQRGQKLCFTLEGKPESFCSATVRSSNIHIRHCG